MTTDNGLTALKVMRRRIEIFRRRMEYLEDCIAEAIDDGGRPNSYDVAEVEALRWALPVLEAEWDATGRLRQVIECERASDA